MLMRTDPLRELDRLTEALWGLQGRPSAMPMTAYREGDAFVVHVDLPGATPETIDATVERNQLTIRAERRAPVADGEDRLIEERAYGTFSRQLVLGDNLALDDLAAADDAGVLTVKIPIAEQAQPRKVEIKGAEEVKKFVP